ncbi:small, acid-soluble spore protein, alpha/beta type [Bacillus cereus]|uniref:small, acid-soluble spore protein, alpha/beta type n=1 Tax=Bacillus cereus TaxID=1396 RepID=UPI0035CB7B92
MAIQNINVLIKGTGNAIDQTKYEIAQEFGIQFGPDKIPLANIYYNTSRIQV